MQNNPGNNHITSFEFEFWRETNQDQDLVICILLLTFQIANTFQNQTHDILATQGTFLFFFFV